MKKLKLVQRTTVAVLTAALVIPMTYGSLVPSASAAGASSTKQVVESVTTAKAKFPGPTDPKEVEAFTDKFFADNLQKYNAPGAEIVVVKDGKVILQKGYGYANLEKKTPIEQETTFRLGSVSKVFTATAVMQLVDEGKIDLDADVQKYMGGIKIPNKTGKTLTMRHLLTHTTGFDHNDAKPWDVTTDIEKVTSIKDYIIDNMPTVVRNPGEAYSYDNFASMLQGYIVETVSGEPFETYMKDHIFKPLNMNDSSFTLTPDLKQRLATEYAGGTPFPDYAITPTVAPQGSMVSTAGDVAKFMMMHLNAGSLDGNQILSKKSINQMDQYQYSVNPSIPNMTFGFENFHSEYANGQHVVEKGGNVGGSASWMFMIPDQNVGVFVIYNERSDLRFDLYKQFMDHYYPNQEKKPTTYLPLSKEEAAPYVGLYRDLRKNYWFTKVSYKDGSLLVEDNNAGTHTLKKVGPMLFEDETGERLAFREDKTSGNKYLYYKQVSGMEQKLEEKAPYKDVPEQSSYKTFIDNMHTVGIMNGTKDGMFVPQGTMTRAEFIAAIIDEMGVVSTHSYKAPFVDTVNHPLEQEINAAAQYSWIQGGDGAKFEPDRPITREEAAVFLDRVMEIPKNPANPIKLLDPASDWAIDSISALLSNGIVDPGTVIEPDGSVNFHSKENITRQDAAAYLSKVLIP